MVRTQNPNLETLTLAVNQLGELADEMVFLGGCATGLLLTDVASPPLRVTRDVDAIVQVMLLADYHKLSNKLRTQGFREDVSPDAPVCRWLAEGTILDVITTNSHILGFGNKWYEAAIENAGVVQLPSGKSIRTVSAPYFLVTKLEAFDGRGGGDFQASHDMEDIVAVLDGRPELIDEIKQAEPKLSIELSTRFKDLLKTSRFVDAISGHMPSDETSQARAIIVKNILKEISNLKH